MVNLALPSGARDLLPLDVAQKQWIETRLQATFRAWGYHCIITPTLEHLSTLTLGGAIKLDSVIQVDGANNEILGLRPELTASIARAYAARLGKVSCPQRLYYNDNVFRKLPSCNRQEEFYQSGVELLGGGGLLADIEILSLLAEALRQVNLPNWQMVLGDVRLTNGLLEAFPLGVRQKIRRCLAELDRVGVFDLELPDNLRSQALDLIDLRGEPQSVLANLTALSWVEGLDQEITYLKHLIELIETQLPVTPVLDLSLIQTYGYYTGIVFEVVSGNYGIAQGGRYDQLLGLYHPQGVSYPCIGFCLNLEDLHKVLAPSLPDQVTSSAYLVVASAPEAINYALDYATQLRARGTGAVELELKFGDRPEVLSYAKAKGIATVVWVDQDGAINTECL